MKPEAAICHPGPMNRGLEISADAADAANLDLGPSCGRRLGPDERAVRVAGRGGVTDLLIRGADLIGGGAQTC